MPEQLLSTSDGGNPSDYATVKDTDDLIMAVANTTGDVDAEIKVDGNDIHVDGSTVSAGGTTSLDLVPDNASLRVNPGGSTADVYLFGNYYGQ